MKTYIWNREIKNFLLLKDMVHCLLGLFALISVWKQILKIIHFKIQSIIKKNKNSYKQEQNIQEHNLIR